MKRKPQTPEPESEPAPSPTPTMHPSVHESAAVQESALFATHAIEKELANLLKGKEHLTFEGLVVRRMAGNAICLEGSVRIEAGEFDLEDFVRHTTGANRVVNRLHMHRNEVPAPMHMQEISEATSR